MTPRSELILAGTPNHEIQQEIKALAQSSAKVDDRGTASGLNVTESSRRNGNMRNRGVNMLLNFTPLTVQKASCPVRDILGEARPDKCSQNYSLGRTNTRVREVVCSIKNLSAERKRNQRLRRTGGEVTEAEIPRKDLSSEPEPHQQLRWRLLKKGEREHLPQRSENRVDGRNH